MEKSVRSAILICAGVFIFLAPLKFGVPSAENGFPGDVIQWIIFSWPAGILNIAVWILTGLWLLWNLCAPQIKIRYSILDIFVAVFILTAAISMFNAPNRHRAHQCLTQYLTYFFVYFLILNNLRDEKDIGFFIKAILISAVFISFYAVYQYYVGLPETRIFAGMHLVPELLEPIKERLASNRVFATFVYPNTLTGYLILVSPPAVSFLFKKRMIADRLLWFLVVLIMFYALFLTFHQGEGSVNRIKNTTENRWEYWIAGAGMIKEHPILGAGVDNFSSLYSIYKLDIAEEVRCTHNNFLQIWAEQGIFGFLAFCMIWFIAIKSAFSRKVAPGLCIGLILFVLHNLIDFDWYIPGLMIVVWTFIAIIIFISGRYREKIYVIKNRLTRTVFLAIVFTVFASGLYYLEKELIADYYFSEAKKNIEAGRLDFAEVFARTSMRFDGDNPDVYFLLAGISVSKGDYAQGIKQYKKALEYDTCNPAIYYNLALSHIYQIQRSGDMSLMQKAGDAFRKAVEFYPTNPLYRLGLARFYDGDRENEAAIEEYKMCLLLNEKIKKEYSEKGKILKQLMIAPDVENYVKQRIEKNK